ncbi:class IIb bacteriocin, lactobin A/cerein 7B family [Flavobacterium sp.]|jgi:hypothetical protein|uniref:class IIb bacteriocin, lactobin A/cerein 7B family n=1 Tax=Flavobacterium sp. TaxID=239 RepID=UPI0037BEC889
MNLEKLNLVELNAQEVVEVEGGTFWNDIAYGVGYVVGTFAHSLNNIEPRVYQRW